MRADAIVIGGGPAGCSAAIRLAEAGLKVRLYEKSRFPREKLCGGYLSAEALPELAELGLLQKIQAAGAWQIHRVLVSAPSGSQAVSPLTIPALSISRSWFDALLLERARESGVVVMEGEDGFNHLDNRAWTVIAAGRKGTSGYFGLQALFDDVSGISDQIELDMIPGGYFGIVRQGRFVNVCGLVDQTTLRVAGPDLDQAMRNWAKMNPVLYERMKDAKRASSWQAVGPVQIGMRQLVQRSTSDVRRRTSDLGPGTVFFVGDAACVVDPFAGEGIAMGLVTGRILKEAILQSSEDPQKAYQRLWHNQFDGSRRLQTAICWAVMAPWWQELLVKSCQAFPALMRWLTDNTRVLPSSSDPVPQS